MRDDYEYIEQFIDLRDQLKAGKISKPEFFDKTLHILISIVDDLEYDYS